MAKKPRSQRRKKGNSLGDNDDDGTTTNLAVTEVDLLSDSFTVADSISTAALEEEYLLGDKDGDDEEDTDFHKLSDGRHELDAATARHSRLVEALACLVDFPTEKRAAQREIMLRRLFKAVTQCATGMVGRDTLEQHLEALEVALCDTSLRRSGASTPAEQYVACRVLEATSVILGGDQDAFWERAEEPLRRIVLAPGRASAVRVAALRALSMANFCCCTDEVTTEGLLDLCESLAAPTFRNETLSPNLRAAALDCWALLSTTVHDLYIAGQDDGHTGRGLLLLELLRDCLDGSTATATIGANSNNSGNNMTTIELRSAAGECVAFIHESRVQLGYLTETENTTERKYRPGSWQGSPWEPIIDDIQQRMSELAAESSHYLSKKLKKEQRATFREFLATIDADESPTEMISYKGATLRLDSWKQVIQLNFLRTCLQGGFQVQLLTNPTLHAMFGSALETAAGGADGLSALEKRLLLSKTSEAAKTADLDRIKKRRVRTNVKNHFLTIDGDDI